MPILLSIVILFLFPAVGFAKTCKVTKPNQFVGEITKVNQGKCDELQITKSMEIPLLDGLQISTPGKPVHIFANTGMVVQIDGTNFDDLLPGLTVSADEIAFTNLTFRNFPREAMKITGDSAVLKQMTFQSNGSSGTAMLTLTGNDILLQNSRVTGGFRNGIEIVDDYWPASCEFIVSSSRARNIQIIDTEIDNNQRYGLYVAGFETKMERISVHHNHLGGMLFDSESRAYQCKVMGSSYDPLKYLHTFYLKELSFYSNGDSTKLGIQTSGPILPKPVGLVAHLNQTGDLILSGQMTLSTNPQDPFSLGLISTQNLEVEVYAAYPGENDQGKIFLGRFEVVKGSGAFQITIEAANLLVDEMVYTAFVSDKVLKISSDFAAPTLQGAGVDTDTDDLPDGQEILKGTDPRNPDSDSDGLKDGFEITQKLDPLDPDSDGDCLIDGLEAGVTKAIILSLRSASLSSEQLLVLPQSCIDKAIAAGEISPKNGIWSGSATEGWEQLLGLFDLETTTLTNPLSVDSDGDGLRDDAEDLNLSGALDLAETDAVVEDTDQDGLKDGEEIDAGTDPRNQDSDKDGAPDGEEVHVLESDPLVCDSDGDGLGDGLESGVIFPSAASPECRGLQAVWSNFATIDLLNPTEKDSDGDGLQDGGEDKNRNGWVDFNETDPTLSDTDGDGLNDGAEMILNIDLARISNGENCSPPLDSKDVDCDQFINPRDLDSDNDACLDKEEGTFDRNSDGVPDFLQSSVKGCLPSGSGSGTSGGTTGGSGGAGGGGLTPTDGQNTGGSPAGASETTQTEISGGGACQLVSGKMADPSRNSLFIFSVTILLGFLFLFRTFFPVPEKTTR